MYADLLTAHDVDYRRGPSDELILKHCLWCADGDPRGGNCYVNGVTGQYYCHRCGEKGGPSSLGRFFGVQIDKSEEERRTEILGRFSELAEKMLWSDAGIDALAYLRSRGMSDESIRGAGLGYMTPDSTMTEEVLKEFTRDELISTGLFTADKCFFDNMIVIPYLRYGRVDSIQGRAMFDTKSKYRALPGRQLHLYGIDAVHEGCNVVLVEGALDAIVVQGLMDQKWTVVGLPGVQSNITDIIDLGNKAKRVMVAFDDDRAGHDASSNVVGKIGPRAVQVFPTNGKDWTEMHQSGGDVRGAIEGAYLGSKRLVSLSEAGKRHRDAVTGKKFKTGMTGIDLTTGGFRQGQVVVPIARAGSGKSTLLANWVYNMSNANLLMASLELTSGEFFSMLSRVHLGHNPSHSDQDIYDRYPNLRIYDENTLNVDRLEDLLNEYEEETGQKVEVLMVDYLQYAARGGEGGEYERVTKTIMAMKAIAKRRKVLIVAPSQVNRMAGAFGALTANSVRGAGTVEETADFVFGIYRDDLDNEDAVKGALNISILKSRAGGQGRELFMRFCPMSLRVIDQSDALAMKRADEEWDWAESGGTYDDWVSEKNLHDIWKQAQ